MHRRSFLRSSAASLLAACTLGRSSERRQADSGKPRLNILIIIVDEMRLPSNMPAGWQALLPRMTDLWSRSASFGAHYTATSDCSPSRATLLTGLYGQQHYLLTTRSVGSPSLQPGFKTYGQMLRDLGYVTSWHGKWHLSSIPLNASCTEPLDSYGFDGGMCPDPVGTAQQGAQVDPDIAQSFIDWLGTQTTGQPWCATVSFVNPHDVQWFWTGSDCPVGAESNVAVNGYDQSFFGNYGGLSAPNFEDPSSSAFLATKPLMQQVFATGFTAGQWGPISWDPATATTIPKVTRTTCRQQSSSTVQPYDYWYKLLQMYLAVQQMVDYQVGRVIDALSPTFNDETLVIFTSDHGEYAGAHGQRGKGGMAYEEGISIPLSVFDPSGAYVSSPGLRTGLTSSVDLVPLLLTLANQGATSSWSDPSGPYGFLSRRFDLSTMLADPAAPGRPYVLFSTDESFPNVDATTVANHVLAYRTTQAKLVVYDRWGCGTIDRTSDGEQLETYDYTGGDRSELDNVAVTDPSNPFTQLYYDALFGTSDQPGLVHTELQDTTGWSDDMTAARGNAISDYEGFVACGTQVPPRS